MLKDRKLSLAEGSKIVGLNLKQGLARRPVVVDERKEAFDVLFTEDDIGEGTLVRYWAVDLDRKLQALVAEQEVVFLAVLTSSHIFVIFFFLIIFLSHFLIFIFGLVLCSLNSSILGLVLKLLEVFLAWSALENVDVIPPALLMVPVVARLALSQVVLILSRVVALAMNH